MTSRYLIDARTLALSDNKERYSSRWSIKTLHDQGNTLEKLYNSDVLYYILYYIIIYYIILHYIILYYTCIILY